MIDRYLLRYFLAVIDHGNFSKAAAYCNVSQPTLSAGIAKLETLLGRSLFNRTNRRVELTEAAVQLAGHARRIEAEFAAAEREVQQASAQATIRLGILSSIPAGWIEDYAVALRESGTGERVEFIEARERDLTERLARGSLDAALTVIRDDVRFPAERLFREGYALAMAETHPLAGRAEIDGAELGGEPMIVRRHCELLSDTSRYFTARGVRPFFPARVTSDDRALRLVRAGLGITVMPDCFRAPGVVRPRLGDFPFSREVGLLFGEHADARLRGRRALTLLAETIESCSVDGFARHPV
ncbi:LysR family transcriptional regulator [Sphingomonas sp. Root710]|uniref:LysR family transcriptional regulator n=1 Tax=Sphingomonas sp. Root710 TaxID=1736594 RepID=UPI0006F99F50|nr:LysR family transcriptional regulator [Sphingomonas sp. Root710]KRB82973.1 LysR family transcriptional regulator [Sphingomonas sp. Root710]